MNKKKALFGCLGGCGLLVLMLVASCVGFTMWLNAPGEVLDPRKLLGSETTGYVEWTMRLEDPGTADFVEGFLTHFSGMSQEESPLPEGLQDFLSARQMKKARKDMEKLFPIVIAWTARPGETLDDDEHLGSVSARGASHQMMFADWIFGMFIGRSRDVRVDRHEGEKIYIFPTRGDAEPAIFIRKGIVFIATDLDSAHQTLARLKLPVDRRATTELDTMFGSLAEERSLRGAVTNRNGELQRVLDIFNLPDEHSGHEAWGDVRGATISAGFEQELFAGSIDLLGPSTSWARDYAEALGPGVASLFERIEIDFVTEVTPVGDRIRIEFSTDDLFGSIESKFDEARR